MADRTVGPITGGKWRELTGDERREAVRDVAEEYAGECGSLESYGFGWSVRRPTGERGYFRNWLVEFDGQEWRANGKVRARTQLVGLFFDGAEAVSA